MVRLVTVLVCALGVACAPSSRSPQYDLVINGGRVIDPETKLDAVRSVGIVGDRIARISAQPLEGTKVIDATGLVVSPGFIDLHQHDHSPAAYRLKALDGVTSALEMETGVPDFARFVAVRDGKALINYGATVSQEAARVLAFGDTLTTSVMGEAGSIDDPPSGPATNNVASDDQVARQVAFLDQGLAAVVGAIDWSNRAPGSYPAAECARQRDGLPDFVIPGDASVDPGSARSRCRR